jgi:hypothetical protein
MVAAASGLPTAAKIKLLTVILFSLFSNKNLLRAVLHIEFDFDSSVTVLINY